MNLNIWGDFQICISVPLSTMAEKTKLYGVQKSETSVNTNKDGIFLLIRIQILMGIFN